MDIEAQYMDAPHRRVVDLRRAGLAEIPMLGMYSYSRARPDLPEHRHAGGWEVCFLERGSQTFQVQDQIYRLRGGDVFLTFPNEPHSTGGSPTEPGVLYWLNLRVPAARRRLLGLPRAEGAMLLAALADLPHRHFRATSPTKSLFKERFRWHDSPAGPDRTLRLRLAVTRLLLEVMDAAGRRAKSPSSERITEIIRLIRSHPARDFGLEDLARHARLSLSHFKKRFRAETGPSPRQFILRDKIEAAKRVLCENSTSVTDIALDLGFVSSQYFATVFKRITGVTPSLYRDHTGLAQSSQPAQR
ncbi:MAG: helix-turn-helix transcriptional regulator [Pirellulaceae bacterium]